MTTTTEARTTKIIHATPTFFKSCLFLLAILALSLFPPIVQSQERLTHDKISLGDGSAVISGRFGHTLKEYQDSETQSYEMVFNFDVIDVGLAPDLVTFSIVNLGLGQSYYADCAELQNSWCFVDGNNVKVNFNRQNMFPTAIPLPYFHHHWFDFHIRVRFLPSSLVPFMDMISTGSISVADTTTASAGIETAIQPTPSKPPPSTSIALPPFSIGVWFSARVGSEPGAPTLLYSRTGVWKGFSRWVTQQYYEPKLRQQHRPRHRFHGLNHRLGAISATSTTIGDNDIQFTPQIPESFSYPTATLSPIDRYPYLSCSRFYYLPEVVRREEGNDFQSNSSSSSPTLSQPLQPLSQLQSKPSPLTASSPDKTYNKIKVPLHFFNFSFFQKTFQFSSGLNHQLYNIWAADGKVTLTISLDENFYFAPYLHPYSSKVNRPNASPVLKDDYRFTDLTRDYKSAEHQLVSGPSPYCLLNSFTPLAVELMSPPSPSQNGGNGADDDSANIQQIRLEMPIKTIFNIWDPSIKINVPELPLQSFTLNCFNFVVGADFNTYFTTIGPVKRISSRNLVPTNVTMVMNTEYSFQVDGVNGRDNHADCDDAAAADKIDANRINTHGQNDAGKSKVISSHSTIPTSTKTQDPPLVFATTSYISYPLAIAALSLARDPKSTLLSPTQTYSPTFVSCLTYEGDMTANLFAQCVVSITSLSTTPSLTLVLRTFNSMRLEPNELPLHPRGQAHVIITQLAPSPTTAEGPTRKVSGPWRCILHRTGLLFSSSTKLQPTRPSRIQTNVDISPDSVLGSATRESAIIDLSYLTSHKDPDDRCPFDPNQPIIINVMTLHPFQNESDHVTSPAAVTADGSPETAVQDGDSHDHLDHHLLENLSSRKLSSTQSLHLELDSDQGIGLELDGQNQDNNHDDSTNTSPDAIVTDFIDYNGNDNTAGKTSTLIEYRAEIGVGYVFEPKKDDSFMTTSPSSPNSRSTVETNVNIDANPAPTNPTAISDSNNKPYSTELPPFFYGTWFSPSIRLNHRPFSSDNDQEYKRATKMNVADWTPTMILMKFTFNHDEVVPEANSRTRYMNGDGTFDYRALENTNLKFWNPTRLTQWGLWWDIPDDYPLCRVKFNRPDPANPDKEIAYEENIYPSSLIFHRFTHEFFPDYEKLKVVDLSPGNRNYFNQYIPIDVIEINRGTLIGNPIPESILIQCGARTGPSYLRMIVSPGLCNLPFVDKSKSTFSTPSTTPPTTPSASSTAPNPTRSTPEEGGLAADGKFPTMLATMSEFRFKLTDGGVVDRQMLLKEIGMTYISTQCLVNPGPVPYPHPDGGGSEGDGDKDDSGKDDKNTDSTMKSLIQGLIISSTVIGSMFIIGGVFMFCCMLNGGRHFAKLKFFIPFVFQPPPVFNAAAVNEMYENNPTGYLELRKLQDDKGKREKKKQQLMKEKQEQERKKQQERHRQLLEAETDGGSTVTHRYNRMRVQHDPTRELSPAALWSPNPLVDNDPEAHQRRQTRQTLYGDGKNMLR